MSRFAALAVHQNRQANAPGDGILQRKCSCSQDSRDRDSLRKKRAGMLQRSAVSSSLPNQIPVYSPASEAIQTQLTINTPGDKFEQEADRAAGRALVAPGNPFANLRSIRIQRLASQPAAGTGAAPASVSQTLATSGRSLEPALRQDMQQRFGYDFSQVRVHTGSTAQQSARDVNALAYTVGQDIVFAAGQFAPETQAGRRLLAHELAHVVQQDKADHRLQRWADCTPARLSLQDCPPRVHGEVQRARSDPMYFYPNFTDPASGRHGALLVNFNIGSAAIKPGLRDNQEWRDFQAGVEANGSRWSLLGFSDCQGQEAPNIELRNERAAAVSNAFPPQTRSQVVSQEAAPIHDCITENSNASQRSFNRSVALIYEGVSISFPGETIQGRRSDYVCGPDVTSQIAAAVAATGAAFARWSSDEKSEACDALDSLRTGACAWDIIELHNNAWIYRNYRPTCATQGATPPCGSTVQVGDQCYYAGSANYVIFGKMCKLCADHYLSIPLINTGYARFTRRSMEDLIDLYKGHGFTGLATPSANYRESVQWANAGYDGWPSGGTPPAGDRPNCAPLCPTPYRGPSFTIEWAPHMDPYNCS